MTFRVDLNTGTAAVPVWAEVTSYVRSWSFSRGRDRFLSGFAAGDLSITFDNRLRTFDPLNSASSVQSAIVPRGQVRVFWDYGTSAGGTRTNLALNPSFETGTTRWTSDFPIAQRFASSRYGSWAYQFGDYNDGFGTGDYIRGEVGALSGSTTYTLSFYYSAPISLEVFMRYDSTNVSVGSITEGFNNTGTFSSTFITPSSVGTNQYVEIQNTTDVAIQGGGPQVLPIAAVDGFLLETGAVLGSYFDGSFTDTDINEYAWTGTAHDSTSTDTFDIETGFQYVGYITDWDLQYPLNGDSTARLTAADGFTLLANQTVPNATQPLEQTGTRINRLLNSDSVQWPADRRNIASGNRYLTTDTTSNENALDYFQEIALTELGELFVAKNGDLTYRDSSVNNPSPADVVLAFADDGTGIKYESVQVEYGSEQLTNRFTVSWTGGDVQADNLPSQLQYGVTEDSATTLSQNLTDATSLADYYVNRFGEPLYRITELSMNVRNLSSSDRDDVLGLELGDVVTVTFTPNDVGTAIFQYAKVTRISQYGDPGLDYYITFGLETFTTLPLVLGDAEYGKIGDNYVLGF